MSPNYYADPRLAGWRGHIARAARAKAAASARQARKDAHSRRVMAIRVAEALAATTKGKR